MNEAKSLSSFLELQDFECSAERERERETSTDLSYCKKPAEAAERNGGGDPRSSSSQRDCEEDKCMARLQELQYTTSGSTVIPCKQESIKMKNGNPQRSSSGNFPIHTDTEEWRRMSLPAMLLGETVGEIVTATRNIVQATTTTSHMHDDPTTPEKMKQKPSMQLHERRKREKQRATQTQSDASSSSQRVKTRIDFEFETDDYDYCSSSSCRYVVNRVSPRNRPWARKTVLFPNPLFQPSPVILIKPAATSLASKSQRAAAVLRRSFSPSRLGKRLVSPFNFRKATEMRS